MQSELDIAAAKCIAINLELDSLKHYEMPPSELADYIATLQEVDSKTDRVALATKIKSIVHSIDLASLGWSFTMTPASGSLGEVRFLGGPGTTSEARALRHIEIKLRNGSVRVIIPDPKDPSKILANASGNIKETAIELSDRITRPK